ncbi:MAG: hypothetical protein IPK52_21935 [Chloroflexi bacterium]|nr:hypothetical protein [Chloroflexota bacterium]
MSSCRRRSRRYRTGWSYCPSPPQPFEPLPDATNQAPPYEGWISYESDHPAVRYSTPWDPRLHTGASRGQYHRSDDPKSGVSLAFEGDGLRIRFVAARNMGMFEIIVDGVLAIAPLIRLKAFPVSRSAWSRPAPIA